MKYQFFGDIHGETHWKNLLDPSCIQVFLGDYFSPYKLQTFEQCKDNFLDIVEYKKQHPEIILLLGNHDVEYWKFKEYNEAYSRHDYDNEKEIYTLFENNKEYFQIAYSIEDKVLVSHAGVSYVWYEKYKNHNLTQSAICLNKDYPKQMKSIYTGELCDIYPVPPTYSEATTPEEAYKMYVDTYQGVFAENNINPREGDFIEWHDILWRYNEKIGKFEVFSITPNEIEEFTNKLWEDNPYAFTFTANANYNDYYGTSSQHGPLWIRWNTLCQCNIFKTTSYKQIVGHTMDRDFKYSPHKNDWNLICIDCMAFNPKSLILNI